eukprot:4073681-Prorocentrum_lima.AAC.1
MIKLALATIPASSRFVDEWAYPFLPGVLVGGVGGDDVDDVCGVESWANLHFSPNLHLPVFMKNLQ